MPVVILIKGILVGIVIALPVGPVGLLCVRRTLFEGIGFGLVSGLGAAVADTIFGVIAGLGLTVIRDEVLAWGNWLGAAGGVFLLYGGVQALWGRRAAATPEPLAGEALVGAFASAFALTITNPVTILAFAAIFAKVGIEAGAQAGSIGLLVAGVFIGSALWWLMLAFGIAALERRTPRVTMVWLNRLSGVILAGSGAGLIIAAIVGRS